MILDELKGISDDFTFNEDHIAYLINNYRALALKKQYANPREISPNSNYQTKCLDLEVSGSICGQDEDFYLRSKQEISNTLGLGNTKIHTCNYFMGDITFIPMHRMKYVGNGKYTKNLIYGTIGPDNHVYLKSNNPQFAHLEKIQVTAIFEDFLDEATKEASCDIMDIEVPIETALIPVITEMIVRELSQALYKPEDRQNNGRDSFSDVNSPRRIQDDRAREAQASGN